MESIPFDEVSPAKPIAPYLGGKRLLAKRIIERIEQIPHRIYAEPFVGMGGVFLRRSAKPKAEFITRYDRPDALFYLDPPYWGCETDYGKAVFSRTDFEALTALLKGIKGRFILSINDVPEIRDLFSWAVLEEVELNYTISKKATKPARELIISKL